MNIDWQAVEAVSTFVAVIVALSIAIFQDRMRTWIMQPELEVSIDVKPPDCTKIPMAQYDSSGRQTLVADTYYLRMRVTNQGDQKAESVEVFAAKLLKRQADGSFKEVNTFLPMNLVWAHYRKIILPAISPKMYRHCDLGHVIDPQARAGFTAEDKRWPNVPPERTILSFDTAVKPHTLSHLVPFGTYR